MLNIRNFRNFSGDDGFIIVDGIENSTLGGKKRLSDIMVPFATSADAGMVLTVGEEGNAEWQEFIEKEIPSASPTDEGKVLTIDSAGKPDWYNIPEDTFIAEYNVTTYEQLEEAYEDSKQIILKYQPSPQGNPDQVEYLRFCQFVPYAGFMFETQTGIGVLEFITCNTNNGVTVWNQPNITRIRDISAGTGLTRTDTFTGMTLSIDTTNAASGNVLSYNGTGVEWKEVGGGGDFPSIDLKENYYVTLDKNYIKKAEHTQTSPAVAETITIDNFAWNGKNTFQDNYLKITFNNPVSNYTSIKLTITEYVSGQGAVLREKELIGKNVGDTVTSWGDDKVKIKEIGTDYIILELVATTSYTTTFNVAGITTDPENVSSYVLGTLDVNCTGSTAISGSHIEGFNNTNCSAVTGSHIEGYSNSSCSAKSGSKVVGCQCINNYALEGSIIGGESARANKAAVASIIFGFDNSACSANQGSIIFGTKISATTAYYGSLIYGSYTSACSAQNGTVEGYNHSNSIIDNSHLEGQNNTSSSATAGSHIEGYSNTNCSAIGSHIEGSLNARSYANQGSHIEGSNNYDGSAIYGSHIEGYNNSSCTASYGSHIEGYNNSTPVTGLTGIHVGGGYNAATNDFETVVGKYCNYTDISANKPLFVVGNGEGPQVNLRSDAFIVQSNGLASATNLGTSGFSDVDAALSALSASVSGIETILQSI